MISVIIPSYNSNKTIINCLDSLKHQKTCHPYEIVVADSSRDNTAAIIEENYPEAKLIRLTQRTYPGSARNIAVNNSKGDVIAFLDADCVVPLNWIEKIANVHKSGYKVVGGSVLNGTQHSYIGTAEHILEFSEYFELSKAQELRMIPTCNLSISRDVFNEAGQFESVETAEDLFLCHRLRELGYTIRFDPSIKVYHHNRTELRCFIRNQVALGFSSALVRKLVKTKGSFFVKVTPLILLIPAIKNTILLKRMVSCGFFQALHFLFHLPITLLGSCFYTLGFIKGVKAPIDISINS